jgi:uncharacterized protein (DUF1501 family)
MSHQSNSKTAKEDLSRRHFLASAPALAAGATLLPGGLTRLAFGKSAGVSRDVLITVFLRGGQDGLSAIVPSGDPAYGTERNNAVGNLVVTPTVFLDPQEFFGFHPSANALDIPFQQNQLVAVHQAGLKDNGTRSHFDSQIRMESGTPDSTPLSDGWVGRVLETIPSASVGLRAATLTGLLPKMYAGAPQTLPIKDPDDFSFPGPAETEIFRRLHLDAAFSPPANPILGGAGRTALVAIGQVQMTDTGSYGVGAGYPGSPFGQALRSIAALMSSTHLDLEAAHVDIGNWDHHDNMGPVSGDFAGKMADMADSMAAFFTDMQGSGINYTMVVQTEFGRRIAPNGSGGADHGKGGLMLLMGPGVNGGGPVVPTSWKADVEANPAASPLLPVNSDNGDLEVKVDYREIIGEICIDRLGLTKFEVENDIFPGFIMPAVDWGVTHP